MIVTGFKKVSSVEGKKALTKTYEFHKELALAEIRGIVAQHFYAEGIESVDIQSPQEKELVAEWWELFIEKPGMDPIRKIPTLSGIPTNPKIPVYGFVTRQELDTFITDQRWREDFIKQCVKIIHVRRTRKAKKQ